jgi:hypothetical protein
MNKLSKIAKIFLFLFVASGAIWLGSYITRLSLFYQIFQPSEFVLKEFVTNQNIAGIFQTLIAGVSINLIFYIVMIISFVLFLFTSKLNLKLNGWLFISTVLIFVSLPFELYLMLIDYKLVMMVLNDNIDSQEVLNLVVKRFAVLSSFPIVEILSYFAVIYLFLFQPLKGTNRKLVE